MAHFRHWKQQFEVGARLVFRKRMKFGSCGVDVVLPGDEVTDEMKAKIGRYRLRLWWDAGRIEIDDKPVAFSMPITTKTAKMEHIGAGWFDVTLPDGTVERVKGKRRAQALIDG